MKKTTTRVSMNLLGLVALICVYFMAKNNAPLFLITLVIVVAACLFLSPYKPLIMVGVCVVFIMIGLAGAFFFWFTSNGMSEFDTVMLCLCLAGSSLICIPISLIIGAIMETVSKGKE